VRTQDFNYELPPGLIAQHPADPRDSSRLMLMNRTTGVIEHHRFSDLPELLQPDDLLVMNNTRVIPARLKGTKHDSGGKVEVLLLKKLAPAEWEALVGGKGLRPGRRIDLTDNLEAEIVEDLGSGRRRIAFNRAIYDDLEALGEMPLPPYITEPLRSNQEYQTIYARQPGSAAAPTAGLHFTQQLMDRLRQRGFPVAFVQLHVGLDTFAPVKEEDPRLHAIHSEWCHISKDTAEQVNAVRRSGGRVIAVGTTTVRTLETAARQGKGKARAFSGPTDLYILPGYHFKLVDAMLTNFHLPNSTLLMMVSAFAGRERILSAYQLAVEEGYRFYSFGDAMLIF
jgi:S-adenosylmethionine:tRNA ribosyltransferase-isomerase